MAMKHTADELSPPTRRALLIGAPAPDLSGVENDLELMVEALNRHAFADVNIDVVVPATSELVEAAFTRLIEASQTDDAIRLTLT